MPFIDVSNNQGGDSPAPANSGTPDSASAKSPGMTDSSASGKNPEPVAATPMPAVDATQNQGAQPQLQQQQAQPQSQSQPQPQPQPKAQSQQPQSQSQSEQKQSQSQPQPQAQPQQPQTQPQQSPDSNAATVAQTANSQDNANAQDNPSGLPSIVPEPQVGSAIGGDQLPDTDLPVSELNSLDIPKTDTEKNTTANPVSDGKNVEVAISEEGVKTITGPKSENKMQTAQHKQAGNDSTSGTETLQAAQPVSSQSKNQPQTAQPATPQSSGAAVVASTDKAKGTEGVIEGDLPADTNLQEIMNLAKQKDASDIHFTANYPVMLRVHGKLEPVTKIISPEQADKHAQTLLSEERKKVFEKQKEIDFSFTSEGGSRFRVNLFTERENSAGALRLIAQKIRTMAELKLPKVLSQIIDEPHGLVLVVGPTGSGKSTTLAAMLNHINMNRSEHIITIEDPIEYVYPRGKSIVNQRELEADTKSWKVALKSALREDPDVVLVGEMRDLDTIESTITIAETGHLTFATLHTNSAAQAVDRIIDVFPEGAKDQIRAQLANVLVAVVSQRLIPIQTGGRRAVLEVMLGTVAVRNAIREGKTYQIDNIIQTSGDLGMITLEKSLASLVKEGVISAEEAKSHSAKPEDLDSLLSRT